MKNIKPTICNAKLLIKNDKKKPITIGK
jgi:hypothetical protein